VSPELNVSRMCVACASVWSWVALQSALQCLKIPLANTPNAHPLFVLYCTVHYKTERERESMCVVVCMEPCACVCVCLCVCVCVLGVHEVLGEDVTISDLPTSASLWKGGGQG
jgi:hypothetical protein